MPFVYYLAQLPRPPRHPLFLPHLSTESYGMNVPTFLSKLLLALGRATTYGLDMPPCCSVGWLRHELPVLLHR